MQPRYNGISAFLLTSFTTLPPALQDAYVNDLLSNHYNNGYNQVFDAQFAHNPENLPAIKRALEAYQQRNARYGYSVAHLVEAIDVKFYSNQFLSFPFSALPADAQKHFIKLLLEKYEYDIEPSRRNQNHPQSCEAIITVQLNHSGANIFLIKNALLSHEKYSNYMHGPLAQHVSDILATFNHVPAPVAVTPAVAEAIRACVTRLRNLRIIPVPQPTVFDTCYNMLEMDCRRSLINDLLRKTPAQINDYLTRQKEVDLGNVQQLLANLLELNHLFIGNNPDHFNEVLSQVREFNNQALVEAAARQAQPARLSASRERQPMDVDSAAVVPAAAPAAQPRLAASQLPSIASLLSVSLVKPAAASAPVRVEDNREEWSRDLINFVTNLSVNNRVDSETHRQLNTAAMTLLTALNQRNYDSLTPEVINVLKQGELGTITENALKFVEQEKSAPRSAVNGPRS